jgi:predicted trehalose synthase
MARIVYEVSYEARYRPQCTEVSLRALAQALLNR